MNLKEYYDYLIEHEIVTEDEIDLVTKINGYNEETLDNILYVRTGYQDLEQYTEYEDEDTYEEYFGDEEEEE